LDERERLERIVEKPTPELLRETPRPWWVSMNCWRFEPSIFAACASIPPSPRGEYELTDAAQHAISRMNVVFHVVRARGLVLDLTSRSDIETVSKFLAGKEVNL
jgi:dTDP-glucose pyrophosphorylase